MRILMALLLALVVAAGVVYVAAGRAAPPALEITQPSKLVGMDGTLDFTVEAPQGTLQTVEAVLEQNGKTVQLFTLDSPGNASVKQETPERMRVIRPLGKRSIPDMQVGTAKVTVRATRTTLRGVRELDAEASREFEARFTPPRVGVVSTHHFINFGSSEMVVYRVTPPEATSGVMVGDIFYPGYPAANAGVAGADASLRVAFFALLHDQDVNTQIYLFARDEAGNQGRSSFDYRVFPKSFRKSRIEVTDAFIQRVVPEILEHAPELNVAVSEPDTYLPAFLKVNNDLRRANAEKIRSLSEKTAPRILWNGTFDRLGNASTEAGFADHRTYFYKGQEIDQQVHLGFDLAVTVNIPVVAANDGIVLFADYLGIYGNTVMIDHGMGLGSLYSHLSAIDVKAGDEVKKQQVVGRSGMTGLAGGDHLHFSMLLGGRPVNSVEWWDPHWIEDRITRKLRDAK
jgi:hypothetical protein